jgi:restriction system protein
MLKMAQNSLFSILMRSPWWISVAIGFAFVGISKLVLPDAYWIFGAFGSLAFFVIGIMAFFKQWKLPSADRVSQVTEKVANLSWKDFSEKLERSFVHDGYAVKRIEGAADFVVTKNGRVGIVCAKRWKAAQQSEEIVQALYSAKETYGAADCTIITLGLLSEKAKRFADAHRVDVMQGPGIAQLMNLVVGKE